MGGERVKSIHTYSFNNISHLNFEQMVRKAAWTLAEDVDLPIAVCDTEI